MKRKCDFSRDEAKVLGQLTRMLVGFRCGCLMCLWVGGGHHRHDHDRADTLTGAEYEEIYGGCMSFVSREAAGD